MPSPSRALSQAETGPPRHDKARPSWYIPGTLTTDGSRMTSRSRRVLLLLAACFFAAQLWQTVRNQSTWPLCSYNMFSRLAPLDMDTLQARLSLASGARVSVNAWEVIPLEFFRAAHLVQRVYMNPSPEETRAALAALLIRLLNESPWGGFDQTYPAPPLAAPVVGLAFVRVRLDLRDPAAPRPTEEQVLYEYRVP